MAFFKVCNKKEPRKKLDLYFSTGSHKSRISIKTVGLVIFFLMHHRFICALVIGESKTAILLVLFSNMVRNYKAY